MRSRANTMEEFEKFEGDQSSDLPNGRHIRENKEIKH